jgi:FAD/FMN-containing dehydrogenase
VAGRTFLAAAAIVLALSGATPAQTIVNDVTQLNPIAVERVVSPQSIEDVSRVVAGHKGPISIGGGRYSQGGQTACAGCLFLDMRALSRIVEIDAPRKRITVQAGATWRQVQEAIDPLNLSVKIMQSYSNFTIGGSISVNCHGDYVNGGPMVSSIRALKIVLADGRVVTASREENAELFRGAVGGYGGLGVIVEATLDLEINERLERTSVRMKRADYPAWHKANIVGSDKAVLHYAIFYPPGYDMVNAVTSSRTTKPLTIAARLAPQKAPGGLSRWLLALVAETGAGKAFRQHIYDPLTVNRTVVNWRNYDAADDVVSLEPKSRAKTTYVLQEYFVPPRNFDKFTAVMARVLNEHGVDVVNISIRHAQADRETYLSWAPEEVFAFVLYYRQGTSAEEKDKVRVWTRALIDAAIESGGRHYLPYQIMADRSQFAREYPRAQEYFALKKRLDPDYKFRNQLWAAYYR